LYSVYVFERLKKWCDKRDNMMKSCNKNIVFVFSVLFICMIAGFFSATLFGSERQHYEIRPEITLPEYKTDMDRAVETYQRIIDNYARLTEDGLTDIRSEINDISEKLDSMDQQIAKLSHQLETVQKKLGIEILKPPIVPLPAVEKPDSQSRP